jgi:beta-glucosidase
VTTKELKGFARVELQPGETRRMNVLLNGLSFAYYDVAEKKWHTDSGDFTVAVYRSVEDIQLNGKITLTSAIDIGVDK